jgi:hypothetical protein
VLLCHLVMAAFQIVVPRSPMEDVLRKMANLSNFEVKQIFQNIILLSQISAAVFNP